MMIFGRRATNWLPKAWMRSALPSILYVWRRYMPLREAIAMWQEAKQSTRLGESRFLGGVRDVSSEFFALRAHRTYEECVTYRCMEGCCSVLWHPRLGNQGGMGPAGCPCDELDDPRDLAHGPLSANAPTDRSPE